MSETNTTNSNAKVWLSIISIFLSAGFGAINYFYTRSVNQNQNERWDKLNIAEITLTDIGFLIQQKLSEQKAKQTNWGYKPLLFREIKDRVYTGYVQVPYALVLVRLPSNKSIELIPHGNFIFTLSEYSNEIKRLNLKVGEYDLMKRFEIQFNFKNIGKTIAKDVRIKIDMIEPRNNEGSVLTQPAEILSEISFNKTFIFFLGMSTDIPSNLKFRLNIQYKDVFEKEHEKQIPIIYDSSRNYWQYGD